MKVIAKTDEYTIYQKRSERYAIKDASHAWINGDQKTTILLEHKLIEAAAVKAPEPEVVEEAVEAAAEAPEEAAAEAPAEEAAEAPEDAAEAPAEEASSEEVSSEEEKAEK